MTSVLILGGGFGGLAAASELRERLGPDGEITVVDRGGSFAMGFAKLWDLAGVRPIGEGTRPLQGLADRGIRFVQAEIEAIDPDGRAVETSVGTFAGDGMLVALGAADAPDQVAMLGEDGFNLYDPAALPWMRVALETFAGGTILLAVLGQPYKCPPAPLEAALLLDEALRQRGVRDDVDLVVATPAPSALPVAGPEASAVVEGALAERDITLRTETLVREVADSTARFDAGGEQRFDLLFGVPGAVPPVVVRESPLAGGSGWVAPEPTTLRTAFPRVYAVGDCTTVPTATAALPKAGVFAAGEAVVAARNLAADLVGGDEATFDGHGFCYLEFPGRRVATVEGNFFALPAPEVALTPPTEEAFAAKVAFERDRLAAWLGEPLEERTRS